VPYSSGCGLALAVSTISLMVLNGAFALATTSIGLPLTIAIGKSCEPISTPASGLSGASVIMSPEQNKSVWPSAVAFATTLAPSMPLAPLRLSATIRWPRMLPSFAAKMRADTSTTPPGAWGMMIRMGPAGIFLRQRRHNGQCKESDRKME
jgi:hypothetical protein